MLAWIVIQTDWAQNWLAKKITKRLSKDLQTEVSVKHVSFSLLDKLNMEGLLIRDRNKDTLLYAGVLKVRVTDWFIFKDKAEIKYASLDNVLFNQYRTDSVWNTQFLFDYFVGDTITKKDKPEKEKQGLILDFKKLEAKNLTYRTNDEWYGTKMIVQAGALNLDANKIDFPTANFDIAKLHLTDPLFHQTEFEGKRIPTKKPKKFYFNPGGIEIKVADFKITNGTYITDNGTRKPYDYFDGAHMNISKLNGTLNNFSFIGDTIKANINVSAKERSGFELKKLQTAFTLTPQLIELDSLDLVTPRSHLKKYYAMRFADINKSMQHYVDSVEMDAKFDNSEVNSDDIAFFAPEVASWKKEILLSGDFKGTVADFDFKNMFVRAGQNTTISGNLKMKGLPDINKTQINFESGNLSTNYYDATTFLPELKKIKNPNLSTLGAIRFAGNFNGTIKRFSTKGNLSTALGSLYTDVAMQFPQNEEPYYTGTINTPGFNIGKLLNNKSLGLIVLNGKIRGSSFDADEIETSFDGKISRFDFNGYSYKNIVTNGSYKDRLFTGEVKIDDPNINFFSNLNIDFTGDKPEVKALGDLARADFKNLKLTNDSFMLAGFFDVDFRGNNIDDFEGFAKVLNAELRHNGTVLNFDSLSLQSAFIEGRRALTLRSNEIDATIVGDYNILELPNTVQSYLHSYYPSYIAAPKSSPVNQRFTLSVDTRNISEYLQIFAPKLKGFDNSNIKASINTSADSGFTIAAYVPQFSFDKTGFTNVDVVGVGSAKAIDVNANIGTVQVSDSLYLPNSEITVRAENDHSEVSIKTKANNTLNEADLNADVYTFSDGVRINFKPSSFVLNDKKWNLEKEGELVIRRNSMSARDVKFTQGYQEISLSTRRDEGSNIDELVVNLKKVSLGDFIIYATKDPKIEGLASGEVVLIDITDNLQASADLSAEQFRLDNDSIGLVKIKADYAQSLGKINYTIDSPNEEYKFSAQGTYDINNKNAPLNNKFSFNRTPITFLSRFLNTIFSDIDGYATGDITWKGDFTNPKMLGTVGLSGGKMKVNFTQVTYTIDTATLTFTDDALRLGTFTVRDKDSLTGTVSGVIYQNGFKDMSYDLELQTDKMLLLDTKATDNDAFYGTATGSARLTLTGPEEDMHMNITGSVNDTSHIFIPTSGSKTGGPAAYMVFRQYGEEMQVIKPESGSVLTIDCDITANNLATIDVILDPLTGDVLQAKGNGHLLIHTGTYEPLTMKGRYNIEEGNYLFNFQSFIRRPFTIRPEYNNYIEWTGDPYAANINIEAQYTADNVNLGDLISNQSISGISGSVRAYRGKVFIIAGLNGLLTKPEIDFRLEFPSGSPVANDFVFATFLAKMETDKNEMLRQVAFLILFGNFAPYGEDRGIGNNAFSLAANTISEAINKQVNQIFSNVLYKLTGDRSLKLDVNASLYNSNSLFGTGVGNTNTNRLDRSRVNLNLSRGILNNKIVISVGSDLDFGVSNSGNNAAAFEWLPNVNIEIILSRDRKLRGIVFYRNSLSSGLGVSTGGAIGQRRQYGASISYKIDFE